MTFPAWVRPGAKCVCIDDRWKDTFQIGSAGPFPVAGQKYTVAGTHTLLGVGYLILAERDVASDFYSVDAFRPVTPLEADVALFSGALNGAATERKPELVI